MEYRANDLLRHLPEREWALLRPSAEEVVLSAHQLLFTDGEPGVMVYFPLTSIISMIAEMENGDECEYGCIGREGMLGLQIALGAQPLRGRGLCQLTGTAVRIDGSLLHSLTASGAAPELHRVLLRYAQATINVLAQSAACNALHSLGQRTARWLLSSQERAGSDRFELTQDFLARMLGSRRASVTAAAGDLQREHVIRYTRGRIEVLDLPALKAASCECYAIIHDQYASVFN